MFFFRKLLIKFLIGFLIFIVMVAGFGLVVAAVLLLMGLLGGGLASLYAFGVQNLTGFIIVNFLLILSFVLLVRRSKVKSALREFWNQIHLP